MSVYRLELKDSLESSKLHSPFLTLVRLGIGTSKDADIPNDVNWNELKALAERHGLSAVVLDGIERLKSLNVQGVQAVHEPPKLFLLEWIGETLQEYDYRYEQYKQVIAEMAAFYNSHDYKMMVLKGYACSLDWPKPEHRPCGDIDIWQFGNQKEADALLEAERPVQAVQGVQEFKVDRSHHHHTVFYWRDFIVENHYDFINVHHHKSNAEVEQVLKELGDNHNLNDNENTPGNGIPCVEVYGEKVYLPSANLHALFLLKHTMMHFAAEGISLRQLLDWGFFMEAHHKDLDWPWFMEKLEQFGMTTMFNIFNAICVEDLGYNSLSFRVESVETGEKVESKEFKRLRECVLHEIMEPKYGDELPKRLIPRLWFKYRRWKGSAWKHKLCYKESMWSAFWSGVWNHLMKPASI